MSRTLALGSRECGTHILSHWRGTGYLCHDSDLWLYPLEKGMATTPVFLPGEFFGQKSLMVYSW